MDVVWTRHAEDRQREWEKRRGVTRRDAEDVLASPDRIVAGDAGAWVAQRAQGDGMLRVVFREVHGVRRILTIYWTSRVERYSGGG